SDSLLRSLRFDTHKPARLSHAANHCDVWTCVLREHLIQARNPIGHVMRRNDGVPGFRIVKTVAFGHRVDESYRYSQLFDLSEINNLRKLRIEVRVSLQNIAMRQNIVVIEGALE